MHQFSCFRRHADPSRAHTIGHRGAHGISCGPGRSSSAGARDGRSIAALGPLGSRLRAQVPQPPRRCRDVPADVICYRNCSPTSRRIAAFPSHTANDLGLALMNLDLHGCVGITAANMLCDYELVSPATFVASRNDAGDLVFEAIEMELLATVEIGRISQAGATTPPSSPKPSHECGQTSSPHTSMSCSTTTTFRNAGPRRWKPHSQDLREDGEGGRRRAVSANSRL